MAESSRVATLVASLMDEEPTAIPPSAPWSSEILAGRARAGRRMYPVLFLLGVAVIGALWFTSVDRNRPNADVQVVRDLLVEADAAEVRWLDDGALGLRGVLEAAPGDPGDVPLTALITSDVELRATVDGETTWVSRVDGGPLLQIGAVATFHVAVRRAAGQPAVDLSWTYLRAKAEGDVAPVPRSRFDEPVAPAEAYLTALLAGDGPRLAGVTAPSDASGALAHAEALGALIGARGGFVTMELSLRQVAGSVPGRELVEITRLTARGLVPQPTVVRVESGCVTIEVSGDPDLITDCALLGHGVLGRPLPLQVHLVQGEHGWQVDAAATEAAVWSHLRGLGGSEAVAALDEYLARFELGLTHISDTTSEPAAAPGARSEEGTDAPAPDSEVSPTPSTPVPSTEVEPPDPELAALPALPAAAVRLDELSGRFGAVRLAELGFVAQPEDLTDFGFRSAVGTAWEVDGDGVFVLAMSFVSAADAAREFEILHGAAAGDGDPGLASYGPGDFSGPTDRGANIDQQRIVVLSGSQHVLIEVWGDRGRFAARLDELRAWFR